MGVWSSGAGDRKVRVVSTYWRMEIEVDQFSEGVWTETSKDCPELCLCRELEHRERKIEKVSARAQSLRMVAMSYFL